jgi:hypothetical protein
VLEITLVGDERRWLVAARRVMERRAQETLVPKCSQTRDYLLVCLRFA